MKYMLLLIVGIYIIQNIQIIRKRVFLPINMGVGAFGLVVIFVSWLNRNVISSRSPFLAAIVFVGALAEVVLLMEITAVKGNVKGMLRAYLIITATIVAVMDILALLGVNLGVSGGMIYLTGTKFSLVYFHFVLMALYLANFNICSHMATIHKIALSFQLLVTVGMAMFVDCATGLAGVCVLAFLLAVYSRYPGVLYRPGVFLTVLLVSLLFSIIFEFVLAWTPVEYVITRLFDRDITMTSRTMIFTKVPLLLRDHYTLGYGFGTTYELGIKLGGFPNTQNALWEWLWQCGVVGTALLLTMIYVVVRFSDKMHQQSKHDQAKFILMLLYVFMFLGTIEVTLDIEFLGYLSMLIPLTYAANAGKTQMRMQDDRVKWMWKWD